MSPPKIRLWLALILFIFAVTLLIASIMPLVRYQQEIPMPPVVLPTPVSLFWMVRGA